MITQIYSIQNVEEALACAKAGADRIGVLVGEKDGPFPCAVSKEEAKKIFEALKGKAMCVLISVKETAEEILKETEYLQPDVLHLCANYEGNAEFREQLRELLPNVQLMEAVGMTGEEAIDAAKAKAEYADLLILDSVSKTVPGVGAAGCTHDWNISRKIVQEVKVPVILAGGLGPENVRAAIAAVKPFGVDSLTKTSVVKDGKILYKDIQKVQAFCHEANK